MYGGDDVVDLGDRHLEVHGKANDFVLPQRFRHRAQAFAIAAHRKGFIHIHRLIVRWHIYIVTLHQRSEGLTRRRIPVLAGQRL